jgi:hypothetical protein
METASTLILSLVLFQPAHAAPDPCRALIPPAVAAAVAAALPGYRLPLATDSDPEARAINLGNGGTGCNAVVSADFNADGSPDFALLLTSNAPGPATLVAVVSGPKGFRVEQLRTFAGSPRGRLFVDPVAAGRYRRTDSADSETLGMGESRTLNSPRSGIVVGVVESWELAFFLTPKGWRHVQIAN